MNDGSRSSEVAKNNFSAFFSDETRNWQNIENLRCVERFIERHLLATVQRRRSRQSLQKIWKNDARVPPAVYSRREGAIGVKYMGRPANAGDDYN